MTGKGVVVILALIGAIVYIQKMALDAGLDGVVLTTTLAALFGLAGSVIHKIFRDRRAKNGG